MSIKAIIWAYKQATGSPLAKAVLARLAEHANAEKAQAWPSVGRIARDTEMSARSVIRYLAQLERMGLITITARIEGAGQTSNLYTLNLPPPDRQTEGGDTQSVPLRHRGRGPVTARQTHIDEPSIEPSMNLPAGVAAACAAGARRLADDLGEEKFLAWFGDAIIEPGPPVTIRAGSSIKARWMTQKFHSPLARAFGRDVVILAEGAAQGRSAPVSAA